MGTQARHEVLSHRRNLFIVPRTNSGHSRFFTSAPQELGAYLVLGTLFGGTNCPNAYETMAPLLCSFLSLDDNTASCHRRFSQIFMLF